VHREEKELNRVLPAIILNEQIQIQIWRKNGLIHRDERDENGRVLPAVIGSDGRKEWWMRGKRHRDDLDENGKILPAYIYSNGDQYWYKNGYYYDFDANDRLVQIIIV